MRQIGPKEPASPALRRRQSSAEGGPQLRGRRYRCDELSLKIPAVIPSFAAITKARGSAWSVGVARQVFGRCPPFTAARLTTNTLRLLGVRIGTASVFWGMPDLAGEGDVCSRLRIGTYCGFNVRTYFELANEITIGDHVAVGQDVMFLTRGYDSSNPAQRGGATISAPIEIGNGAWLGARVTVMPGVKIGPGSVIGASVVVSKDVPANMLVMGTRTISLAKWR